MENNEQYITADLATAAYLMLCGKQLLSASKETGGKFQFTFDDKDVTCQKMAVEFLATDFCKYDSHLRNLKKLLNTK